MNRRWLLGPKLSIYLRMWKSSMSTAAERCVIRATDLADLSSSPQNRWGIGVNRIPLPWKPNDRTYPCVDPNQLTSALDGRNHRRKTENKDKFLNAWFYNRLNYRSARIIKGNSIFSYPAPAQRKWQVVEGLKFFWGVFMAVETDCPNSF